MIVYLTENIVLYFFDCHHGKICSFLKKVFFTHFHTHTTFKWVNAIKNYEKFPIFWFD